MSQVAGCPAAHPVTRSFSPPLLYLLQGPRIPRQSPEPSLQRVSCKAQSLSILQTSQLGVKGSPISWPDILDSVTPGVGTTLEIRGRTYECVFHAVAYWWRPSPLARQAVGRPHSEPRRRGRLITIHKTNRKALESCAAEEAPWSSIKAQ